MEAKVHKGLLARRRRGGVEMRKTYKNYIGIPQGKKSVEKPRRRCENRLI
jgi:hypothetical protein